MFEYLNKLNTKQQQAVKAIDGPLLVIAGAGSGKTAVLTARIAYLLDNGIAPDAILAITFTNKAAGEMKARAEKLAGPRARAAWISTFHSFCVRVLRQEIAVAGVHAKNFTIYDEYECDAVVKECLRELNYDDNRYKPSIIRSIISKAKNEQKSCKQFMGEAQELFDKSVGEIYELYSKKMYENNALDFDDLLLVTVEIFDKHKEVLARYQDKFRYIMVDEYQDTNRVQYKITKMLAAKHRNIFVVGDADQSIYGWRGADIRNILDFEKDYAEAQIVKLEQNYRSTANILDAANCVITNNDERRDKELWTDSGAGNKVTLYSASDERDEADFVARTIKKSVTGGRSFSDCAVLYRANSQSRAIEESFMRAGIPYVIVGGLKFYDRKEIKDILAYLKLLYNQSDGVSFQRVINVPRRGIGQASLQYLINFADINSCSLFEAASRADEVVELSSRARNAITEFAMTMFKLAAMLGAVELPDFVDYLLRETGYLEELERDDTPEAAARVENLKEFIGVAKDYIHSDTQGGLEEFLTHIALITDLDKLEEQSERVTLMTMHAAKGLEYPVVFIAGMEEGLFPHARTLMNDREVEEERRLCYVGITRAMSELFLLRARVRSLFGQVSMNPQSRFLEEIDERYIDRVEPMAKSAASAPRSNVQRIQPILSQPAGFIKNELLGKKTTDSADWRSGDKLIHSTFGRGTVVDVKGSGASMELKAAFPGLGIKALVASLAPIKKV